MSSGENPTHLLFCAGHLGIDVLGRGGTFGGRPSSSWQHPEQYSYSSVRLVAEKLNFSAVRHFSFFCPFLFCKINAENSSHHAPPSRISCGPNESQMLSIPHEVLVVLGSIIATGRCTRAQHEAIAQCEPITAGEEAIDDVRIEAIPAANTDHAAALDCLYLFDARTHANLLNVAAHSAHQNQGSQLMQLDVLAALPSEPVWLFVPPTKKWAKLADDHLSRGDHKGAPSCKTRGAAPITICAVPEPLLRLAKQKSVKEGAPQLPSTAGSKSIIEVGSDVTYNALFTVVDLRIGLTRTHAHALIAGVPQLVARNPGWPVRNCFLLSDDLESQVTEAISTSEVATTLRGAYRDVLCARSTFEPTIELDPADDACAADSEAATSLDDTFSEVSDLLSDPPDDFDWWDDHEGMGWESDEDATDDSPDAGVADDDPEYTLAADTSEDEQPAHLLSLGC
jgi:hypothetical protein